MLVRYTLKLKTPLDRFGIDEDARAEDMTPPQLLALFRAVLLLVRAQSKRQPQRKMSGCLDFSAVAFTTREPIIAKN